MTFSNKILHRMETYLRIKCSFFVCFITENTIEFLFIFQKILPTFYIIYIILKSLFPILASSWSSRIINSTIDVFSTSVNTNTRCRGWYISRTDSLQITANMNDIFWNSNILAIDFCLCLKCGIYQIPITWMWAITLDDHIFDNKFFPTFN